jgi:AraC family transcriptional regulator of adaptative response/methylated-DNA-[protein]-cysteine methyltransferase
MDHAACWRAVETRDASAAGQFFYAVLTTGVFCRPGCSSRTPRRENVRFFPTATEAEALGYRPCRRCRPDRTESEAAARIAGLCRRIDAGQDKTLDQWAAETGWSPAHLQKTFKAATGLSPAQYARNSRLGRLKSALRSSPNVTAAMNDAGYGSSSRLHSDALLGLGMSPSQYKSGGQGIQIQYAIVESPAGLAAIAWTSRGVCFAEFGQSRGELSARLRSEFPHADINPGPIDGWHGALALLEGPVDAVGTAFQRLVWAYLRTIPPGETRTYSQVAAALGQPRAARAVARACAANRIAVGIPCHRVIAADGSLAGYRWGADRKRTLLASENHQPIP